MGTSEKFQRMQVISWSLTGCMRDDTLRTSVQVIGVYVHSYKDTCYIFKTLLCTFYMHEVPHKNTIFILNRLE